MNVVKRLLISLLIMGYAGTVAAIPTTINDETLFDASGAYDSVLGTSDLDGYGRGDVNYLSTDEAQSAVLDFDYIMWTHSFEYDASLGPIMDGTLTLMLRDDTDSMFSADYGLVFGDGGLLGIGEVSAFTDGFDIATNFLEDGSLTVALVSILGGFYIDSSVLSVTYDADVVSAVPEPTTLSMLGIALLLIGFMNRKQTGGNSQPDLITSI